MLQALKSNVYVLFVALGMVAFGSQIQAQSEDAIADFGACLATHPPADCRNLLPR